MATLVIPITNAIINTITVIYTSDYATITIGSHVMNNITAVSGPIPTPRADIISNSITDASINTGITISTISMPDCKNTTDGCQNAISHIRWNLSKQHRKK